MSMHIYTPPRHVIQEDPHLQQLAHRWVQCNKERVFSHKCIPPVTSDTSQKSCITHTSNSNQTTSKPYVQSWFDQADTITKQHNSHVLASYKQVVSSRKDLPFKPTVHSREIDAPMAPDATRVRNNTNQFEMSVVEQDLLKTLCNKFLHTESPCTVPALFNHQLVANDTESNDIVAHACIAYISTIGNHTFRQIHLPIIAPSSEQIARCIDDVTYNNNVQLNVAAALSTNNLKVLLNTNTGECKKKANTVYVDANVPVCALGTTTCCADLLFGKYRTSSSSNFCIGNGLSNVYASAVHKYQKYNNVSIGDHITLVPSFHKRTPMIVSLSCPQLKLSKTTTCMSMERTHAKFGPNHATQAVEVTSKLIPFVQLCFDTYMHLTLEIIEDLREDNNMPVADCVTVDHCFAHDADHGISAYVATHSFSLPTEILNTYILSSDLPFPPRKQITVYIAVIFGGVATNRICTDT
jgi:hypothetical protein